jgi:citrate synthase
MKLFPNELYFICSGVDVFTALSGGVGALYGPLHGGANEVSLILQCPL